MTLCDVGANLYREHVESGTASAKLAWRRHLRTCPVCLGLKSVRRVELVSREGNVSIYRVIGEG
jgi:hypothetical protein